MTSVGNRQTEQHPNPIFHGLLPIGFDKDQMIMFLGRSKNGDQLAYGNAVITAAMQPHAKDTVSPAVVRVTSRSRLPFERVYSAAALPRLHVLSSHSIDRPSAAISLLFRKKPRDTRQSQWLRRECHQKCHQNRRTWSVEPQPTFIAPAQSGRLHYQELTLVGFC